MHTLLKTLASAPSEWLWALETDFQCGAAKGGKSSNSRLFFFRFQRYRFFRALFSSLSYALFVLRLASAKARAHLWVQPSRSAHSRHEITSHCMLKTTTCTKTFSSEY
jgi:hypothetical protein